ncbi:hypothetical protein [Bradyrhizobium sp.]|uniref:hypothetical protein n=1 Tax=Bradyrhizobium sp. TaxID=376 RepID=UPI0039E702F3
MLENAALPKSNALIEALRRRHPGLRWESGPAPADPRADDPILVRAGDHLVAVLLMPAPMPPDQHLWQSASPVWPDAPRAVGRHRAHLVVSTIGSAVEGAAELSPIEGTRLVTAVVGGVIEAHRGCIAVVWCGKVGRSAPMWLEESRRSFEPFPDHPFGMWMEIIHFRCGPTVGAYTVGLSAFIGREIEFEVDGLDREGVTDRVANASSYLIANGIDENVANGMEYSDDDETVGRIRMLHGNSRFNHRPVISFSAVQDRFGRLKSYEIIPTSIARNHPLTIMLSKAGLFDPAQIENKVRLRPDHYVSEVRLEMFDDALSRALSDMLATDDYANADEKARLALASNDISAARSILQPWADEVGTLQLAVKIGLTVCDVFMFKPAAPRSP